MIQNKNIFPPKHIFFSLFNSYIITHKKLSIVANSNIKHPIDLRLIKRYIIKIEIIVVRNMRLKGQIIIGLITIGILISTGCVEQDTDSEKDGQTSYIDLTAVEAKELINTTPELIIIDVSPNYDNGRLPGAVNYYIGDGSLDAAIPTLDKTKPYLVYCHVDSVSISGAQKLIDAGFTTVYRLEGNYQAWVDAGYEIET